MPPFPPSLSFPPPQTPYGSVLVLLPSTAAETDDPTPVGYKSVNQPVIIRLKWDGQEYRGRLVSVDGYMNVQLDGAEEYIGGKSAGTLGQVLIRCNNVLWISEDKGRSGGAGGVDAAMSG